MAGLDFNFWVGSLDFNFLGSWATRVAGRGGGKRPVGWDFGYVTV